MINAVQDKTASPVKHQLSLLLLLLFHLFSLFSNPAQQSVKHPKPSHRVGVANESGTPFMSQDVRLLLDRGEVLSQNG